MKNFNTTTTKTKGMMNSFSRNLRDYSYFSHLSFLTSPSLILSINRPTSALLLSSKMYNAGFGKVGYSTTRFVSSIRLVPSKTLITCVISLSAIMDKELFYDEMLKAGLVPYEGYTVYVKIRYHKDKFFMAGNQFGFEYNSVNDFESLYDVVHMRLEEYFEEYMLDNADINYIFISFRLLDSKLFSDLLVDKNKLNDVPVREQREVIKAISIPSTLSDLGKPLFAEINDKGIITEVEVTDNIGNVYNIIDSIREKSKLIRSNHKDIITEFDSRYKFYYIKSNINYILVIRDSSDNKVEKLKYSLHGVLISRIIDIKEEGNVLIRCSGLNKLSIVNNEVIKSILPVKLKPLSKYVSKNETWKINSNIGVIDIETFRNRNNNDVSEIYALGFRSNLSSDVHIYYIDEVNLNGAEILLELINELLRPKYSNIIFYTHNLGGYDSIFIIKVLHDYNDKNEDKYIISSIFRDNKIITLRIKKGKNSLTIRDSYAILSNSLARLADDYGVTTQKSLFPYRFANENTLFYIGQTPDKDYYENIKEDEYKGLFNENWSFKDESIKYLKNDLNALYEVLTSANEQLYEDYNIGLVEASTISGLSMKIFLSRYYQDNIPLINKVSIYSDIKESYYGGITEVYRPYGKNLFYYDVNSLYPYASLNDMPGLDCSKIMFYKDDDSNNIDNLFGFFYCKIEAPLNLYLGLLPVRNSIGIELPVGNWNGWYFSEELKFAKENGYTISVIKGYEFNRVKNVFTDYVNNIYSIKANPKSKTQKAIAKSLLNNLLGRFGINLEKSITEIMSKDLFSVKSTMNKIVNYTNMSDDKVLVTYVPKLDLDIIESHGLDYIKVIKKYKDTEIQSREYTSIVISSAVTAYARVHINKIKLYILNKGGNIYYSDTDSIVTNIELPHKMVNPSVLGLLKLEHKVNEGIFITNKTYCLKDNNNVFINRAKGIISSSITHKDYLSLLNNNSIDTAVKKSSKINWSEGDVKISSANNIKINSNSYTKRTKIYDKEKWINTKPNIKRYHTNSFNKININYFDYDLVLYKPIKLGLMSRFEFNLNYYGSIFIMKNYYIYVYYFYILVSSIFLTEYFLYNINDSTIWQSGYSSSFLEFHGNTLSSTDEFYNPIIYNVDKDLVISAELNVNVNDNVSLTGKTPLDKPLEDSSCETNCHDIPNNRKSFYKTYFGMFNFKNSYIPSQFQSSDIKVVNVIAKVSDVIPESYSIKPEYVELPESRGSSPSIYSESELFKPKSIEGVRSANSEGGSSSNTVIYNPIIISTDNIDRNVSETDGLEKSESNISESSLTSNDNLINILRDELAKMSDNRSINENRILELETKSLLHDNIVSNYKSFMHNSNITIAVTDYKLGLTKQVESINMMSDKINELKTTLNDIEIHVINSNLELNEKDSKIDNLNAEVASYMTANLICLEEINENTLIIRELGDKINTLITIIDSANSTFELDRIRELESEIESYRTTINDRQTIIDDDNIKLYNLNEVIESLNSELSELNTEKINLVTHINELELELTNSNKEITKLKIILEHKDTTIVDLGKAVEYEKDRVEEYLRWYDDVSKDLDNHKVIISTHENSVLELNSLKESLELEKAKALEYRTWYDETVKQLNDSKDLIKSLKNELSKVKDN